MYRGSLIDTFDKIFYNSLENLPREVKPFLPYNIYKDEKENKTVIEIAVAGYPRDSLTVQEREDNIYIAGKITENINDEKKYLYKGLTSRNFEFVIPYNSNYKIKDVELENGILKISIERPSPSVRALEIKNKNS